MVRLFIDGVAGVVAELRNIAQEKYRGRGDSSRGFTQRIGNNSFFWWAVKHR